MSAKKFSSTSIVIVAGILVVVALIGFILGALEKIRSGHGLDYYFTGFGAKFNYIGAIVLLVCIPIALLVGWGLNYWLSRDERDFRDRLKTKKGE
jgi:nitric oxide reductase large subunit